jgi:hypothetical protein
MGVWLCIAVFFYLLYIREFFHRPHKEELNCIKNERTWQGYNSILGIIYELNEGLSYG